MNLVNKAFKFRIYPTKEQEILIEKTFGCCRFVFNHYLEKSIKDYELIGKSASWVDNCNDSVKLKKEVEWLKEVDSWAITNSIKDLDLAYQNFFQTCQTRQETGFSEIQIKEKFETKL